MSSLDWMEKAKCRGYPDPDAFFEAVGPRAKLARQLCETCQVRNQCADYGLTHEEWGTWGGINVRIEKEPDLVKHVRKLAQQGMDDQEIAEELALRNRQVTKRLRWRHEIPNGRTVTAWTNDELDTVRRLVAGGWEYSRIAEYLGRTADSVRHVANKNGWYSKRSKRGNSTTRNGWLWSDEEIEQLVRLLGEGKSYAEIGKAMGRTREAVRRCYQKLKDKKQRTIAELERAITAEIEAELQEELGDLLEAA